MRLEDCKNNEMIKIVKRRNMDKRLISLCYEEDD